MPISILIGDIPASHTPSYRIALIGSRNWLRSAGVRQLARIPTISRIDASEKPDMRSADVVLMQVAGDPRSHRPPWAGEPREKPQHWLAVTRHPTDSTFETCIREQAWGCIDQDSTPTEYALAIVDAARGRLVYPTHILDRIRSTGGQLNLISSRDQLCAVLTRNQRAFLELLSSGHSLQSSAGTLRIPREKTAEFMSRLRKATNTKTLADMIDFANATGLIRRTDGPDR